MSILLFALATLPVHASNIKAVANDKYAASYEAYYLPSEGNLKDGTSEPSFKKFLRPEHVKKNYNKNSYKNVQVLFECGIRINGTLNDCNIREISPDNKNSRKSVSALVKYYVLDLKGKTDRKWSNEKVFLAANIVGLGDVVPVEEPCIAPLCSITPPPVPVG